MSYNCKVICDSVSRSGNRLTTFELTFPRIVLSEFNTHRMFSRNSASSRAIPVEKMLQRVIDDPFIPVYWGKNQRGMQADEELAPDQAVLAEREWLAARDRAVDAAKRLLDIGIHKQITNRLLEPWLWHTIIVSATEWENFFALRTHRDAQPEIRKAAVMMKEAYEASQPQYLDDGFWHLPLVTDAPTLVSEGFTMDEIKRVSVGRCARVSYLTHHGTRDPRADIELCDRLVKSGHMSPLEHVARPMTGKELQGSGWSGNFFGWVQLRKTIPNEDNFMKVLH